MNKSKNIVSLANSGFRPGQLLYALGPMYPVTSNRFQAFWPCSESGSSIIVFLRDTVNYAVEVLYKNRVYTILRDNVEVIKD